MDNINDYRICHECGSKMFLKNVTSSFKMKDGEVVTFENIPAYVCENKECDEKVYTDDTVKMIEEEILKHRGEK